MISERLNASGAGVRFGLVGDPQYAECPDLDGRDYRGALARHRRLMEIFNGQSPLDFVVNLGDMGDGQDRAEIPAVLESYARLDCPVRHVVGNHDLVLYGEDELRALLGLPGLSYDFAAGGARFVVLDGLDESRFSPEGSARRRAARRYRAERPGVAFRDWDGKISDATLDWFAGVLSASRDAGEKVVVLCHVPILREATGGNTILDNHAEVLALLDRFDHVVAWFSGHHHPGGTALRNGVLHKTVKALANVGEATGLVASLDKERLILTAIGEEASFVHEFDPRPCRLAGRAVAGAWIATADGLLTRCDGQGRFVLTVPAPGVYGLKAFADGMADACAPRVIAPAEDLEFAMIPAPGRRVVHGKTDGPATLRVKEGGRAVHGFDLDGVGFGEAPDDGRSWHEHTRNFWSAGEYVFGAGEGGDVTVEVVRTRHPGARAEGYYKGDFHAHIAHAENHYRVNPRLAAHIARAEGYDWLFACQGHANDGHPADWWRFARQVSDENLLLRLNREFPKNHYGHVGLLGVEPVFPKEDCEAATNFELVRRYVVERGGVPVPVHPFYQGVLKQDDGGEYSHMSFKELWLWLLCDPEMVPCLDLFYNDDDTPAMLRFWYAILDMGYRVGCVATSDAALDVGRSPGSDRGATYVKADRLREADIVRGVRERRTAASWGGALVTLSVDGCASGTVLPASRRSARRARLAVYGEPGRALTARFVHNGRVARTWNAVPDADGRVELFAEVAAEESGYCLALLFDPREPERIASAASPVYFRAPDFRAPATYTFPGPLPRAFRRWMKYLRLDELLDPALRDETRARLLACGATPIKPSRAEPPLVPEVHAPLAESGNAYR